MDDLVVYAGPSPSLPQIIALSLNVLGLRFRTVKRYVYVRL